MRSLKEVRSRIVSVSSTRKITSAMRMVSSVKLRKAQDAVTAFYPYKNQLEKILNGLLHSEEKETTSLLSENRAIQNVSFVVFSSNKTLCGAFNTNVFKKTLSVLAEYKHLNKENIHIYAIGKKIAKSLKNSGYTIAKEMDDLCDNANYKEVADLAVFLMNEFVAHRTDKVILVYNHFKNAGIQFPQTEDLLPLHITTADKATAGFSIDYILEPNREELIQELLPKVVKLHLYGTLLDSQAAEHGARTTAMQIASDNAEDLIQELKFEYNKARQESITKQILDIVGGAEAFRAK